MDSIISDMMEDKSMSFKFLLAVQQHNYEQAYQIGKEILKVNPSDKSVNRFMLFLQSNMGYQEEEEEDEFECEDEEAEEDELENGEQDEEEEEEYEEYEEGQQIQQEDDDSEYEWVYEDEQVVEGFDEQDNTDEEKNFVQEDTNEGDISLSMDKKIQEKKQTQQQQIQQQQQQQQQSAKRVVQQVKPKSSIPNGIPTLPKIQNKQRPISQSKQQIQKPQPLQQNLIKQAAVNQLRFPSSMAKKK